MWWALWPVVFTGAYYLPGVRLKLFSLGDSIELQVDKLDSDSTQLPFEYYYLNFCEPPESSLKHENLGQILQGDRIQRSPYELKMKRDVVCKSLCNKNNTESDIEKFQWMIDNKYRASWVLDNLPAGPRTITLINNTYYRWSSYEDGFPIGYKQNGNYYIYNHMHIVVKVHQEEGENSTWAVVGFLVNPMSLEDDCNSEYYQYFLKLSKNAIENKGQPKELYTELPFTPMPLLNETQYTYSVTFEESEVTWSNRWDYYLQSDGSGENTVHWLSIFNSFAMMLVLSGVTAHTLYQALKKGALRCSEHSSINDSEEAGWAQVRECVFHPPTHPSVFAVFAGSGIQLGSTALFTLLFASLGVLSPAHRGGLLTTMLLLFVLMGILAGYCSAPLYKFFGGINWWANSLSTAVFLPGTCFSMFFVINLFVWAEGSSGAVPFVHLFSILVLWLGISAPLSCIGSCIGYKMRILKTPITRNIGSAPDAEGNLFPSQIPGELQSYPDRAYVPLPPRTLQSAIRLTLECLLAGSLPFSCMFIEFSYVMKSLWHHAVFYYSFGFLLLAFVMLIVVSAEVSIILTYMLLKR